MTASPEHGLSLERAHELTQRLEAAGTATVQEVQCSQQRSSAKPPFRTSTLQQEAARLLGFSVKRTMSTAQELFEGEAC